MATSPTAREPGKTSSDDPTIRSEFVPVSPDQVATSGLAESESAEVGLPSVPGYDILSVLGRGGMGVVYKARQIKLNRIVALKMILAGAHAGPREIVRFRNEAEAVAQMQHPHIVQIYEIGDQAGCPFIALEFVDGGGLADCLTGAPVPARVAAQIVESLALAMHYAHQRGIVHRDLKPGNVLLQFGGSRGDFDLAETGALDLPNAIPKITDFGLAKRLDVDSGQTRSGDVLGTPNYMAPEQAEGRIKDLGPACDVYALGAILYELITGRPPFNAESPFETVLQVINEEPVPPTRLQSKLARDLETICLKCLEKDVSKRYGSAQALAEDLHRFLNHEPILARPVRPWERAWKWAKRRPAVAALVMTCCMAFLALAGVVTQSLVQQRRAAAREHVLRERAETRGHFARRAVDDMYTQVVEKWLANEKHTDQLQREFLDKALAVYLQLAEERSDDPAIRRETALAYYRVGEIHRKLDERDKAEQAYMQALEAQEALLADFPNNLDYAHDVATTSNWLGELLRTNGNRLRDAERAFRRARELQERLVRAAPGQVRFPIDLARTHTNLGALEMDSGRPNEANVDYDLAIEILRDVDDRIPDQPALRFELASNFSNRGLLRRDTLRPLEAAEDFDRAIQHLAPLIVTPRVPPEYRHRLAVFHNNRGMVMPVSEAAAAEAHHRNAMELLVVLVQDYPGRALFQYEKGNTHNFLAAALAGNNELRAAEKEWGQAVDQFERLVVQRGDVPDYHYGLGQALGNLGWLENKRKNTQAARILLEKGVGHLDVALKPNPKEPRYLEASRKRTWDLAEVLLDLRQHQSAAELAASMPRLFKSRAAGCFVASRVLAACVARAREDQELSPQQRQAATQAYGDRAMELLQESIRAGYTSVSAVAAEPAFGPLQDRADFRSLVSKQP